MVLEGGSIIDWKSLHPCSRADVDRLLRLNLFEPDDPDDRRRLRSILRQAVRYLERTFGFDIPAQLARPRELADVFLLAAGVREPSRLRRLACIVLKVMHTVHHVEARELLFRVRMSEAEKARMVEARVRSAVARLRRDAALGIVEFEGSSKPRESVLTKLMAKRESIAAQIYDHHRYRLVVERLEQVPALVLALTRELLPFHYVVPGQTENTLVPPPDDGDAPLPATHNEFSGPSYRILNFVAALPLRLGDDVLGTRRDRREDLGRIVFAPVEFQLVDVATQAANEAGANSHASYKRRQLRSVLARLARGHMPPGGARVPDVGG